MVNIIVKNCNSVLLDTGNGLGAKEHAFMVWPSVGVRIRPEKYMAAVELLSDANDVFFDGELIIVPKEDSELLLLLNSRFEVISVESKSSSYPYTNGFGDEFATKAIELGIDPYLVVLGNSVFGIAGSAAQMLNEVLHDPKKTGSIWRELYLSSMNSQ